MAAQDIVSKVTEFLGLTRPFSRKRLRRYVDAKYYRSAYTDVARAGVDPFQHYMANGWREGRNPSPDFNTLYYRDRHLEGSEVNPLSHFVDIGRTAGLSPRPVSDEDFLAVQRPLVAPLFDPDFYRTQTGQLSVDPLTHYLSIGWQQGKRPNPHFDPTRYHAQHVFLSELSLSPLYHFASQQRLQRKSNQARTLPIRDGTSAQKLRAVIGAEFDRAYYDRVNHDVTDANLDPLSHYIDHGWRESRNPTVLFDSRYYLSTNADVVASGTNPFYHYLTKGRAEGRRGNPVGVRLYAPLKAPPPEAWDRVDSASSTRDADYVVIMPVYKGVDETLAAIYAVLAAKQTVSFALHVIYDAGPDATLEATLERLASKGLFSYSRNPVNIGFVKTINAGLRAFPNHEVVLLNSDAEVYHDWLDRIDRHAKSDPKIATITPMSNNATICSYPLFNANNVIEPECSAADLDSMAAVCNAGRLSDIPTGVGFCFYMSRASRDALGILDQEAFGRGYGEENDFCLRAAKAGFRNVLAEDILVYHAGEVSFAEFAADEYAPGQAALLRKHPDYPLRIQQHLRADPSEYGRMRLDLYRLARALPHAMIFVSHPLGGGIETHARELEQRLGDDGIPVIIIRVGVFNRWSLDISSRSAAAPYCPNLRPMAFNQIKPLLAEFLSWLDPLAIHIHSLVGLDWAATEGLIEVIQQAPCPYVFTLHDYSVVCHRNDLVMPDARYCGLPAVDACRACVASDRDYPEAIDPEVRRQTYDRFLKGAAAVFAPSSDLKERLERAGATYEILVRPHEDLHSSTPPAPPPLDATTIRDVVIIGAIGPHKGSNVILNLARDAKARDLPIRFHIVGYSNMTEEMAAAGVIETGRYRSDTAAFDLVRGLRPACIFLPSIWPETFCYALSMAFDLRVPPVVFDLGAQRDRVHAANFGFVLPETLIEDPQALNERLMALPLSRMRRDSSRPATTATLPAAAYYGGRILWPSPRA